MSSIPQYSPDETHSAQERMAGLINFLSAYVEQYHGGWVRLVEYDGKTLKVELGGPVWAARCLRTRSTAGSRVRFASSSRTLWRLSGSKPRHEPGR